MTVFQEPNPVRKRNFLAAVKYLINGVKYGRK